MDKKQMKNLNIILLTLSMSFYFISYQLEYVFFGTSAQTTLIVMICDICIALAIIIDLVVVILILEFEKNDLKTPIMIVEIILINLSMLSYLGSHFLESISNYMPICCIFGILMSIDIFCNICFLLSIFIPSAVMCLISE